MEVKPTDFYPQNMLDSLLASVAFYRQVKEADPIQYAMLMRCSRLVEYRVGEVVIEAGHTDAWLFFLLKGQLAVYAGSHRLDLRSVNRISSGEVFGDIGVLMKHKRAATVIVDSSCKRALVFCTDFSVFGELENFTRITLSTKLIFYRNMVHSLRWKLEVYRSKFPKHENSLRHHKIKLYSGGKGSLDELRGLHEQAQQLAKQLLDWNLEFTRHQDPDSQVLTATELSRLAAKLPPT